MILVLPRQLFGKQDRFVSLCDSSALMPLLERSTWLPRGTAENSEEWVQPIPCALVRTGPSAYLTLRRVRAGRNDLKSRISLVVGGHIDAPNDGRLDEVSQSPSIVLHTLRRELQEELGLAAKEAQPVGLVIDQSSMQASRHVGVVYEVSATGMLVTSAVEEFAVRSKFTGRYFTPQELAYFRRVFDPWSRIVFDDWIAPRNNIPLSEQPSLPFPERRWEAKTPQRNNSGG